jgi:hypothetical protein
METLINKCINNMNKLFKLLYKIRIKIIIWSTPLVLLFYFDDKIQLRDRIYYFFIIFFKSVPLLLLYSYFSYENETNGLFYAGIGATLFLDMAVGAWYHFKKGDFSFTELFRATILKTVLIAIVYISLSILSIPLSESMGGEMFRNTIMLFTLLYPVKDIVKNAFVLSNGKFPPEFVIKALYNYEKSGKLKEFFDLIEGKKKDIQEDLPDKDNGN